MSHSHATFVFEDATVLYGEYNGTSDVMLSRMYETQQEVKDNWRKQVWSACTCGEEPELCIADADYGGGIRWFGGACRKCMVFVGPHAPYMMDPENYETLIF